ncbi:MAG: reprolysin-like metallopeptidase [Saprospiraceae bacterium]
MDAYQLDEAGLRAVLESAPWECTIESAQRKCVLDIPVANGKTEPFAVWRTAMLDPQLAEACPYLRTYAGVSLTDSRRTVRFSTTLRGFRAMILQPDFGFAMLKPVSPGQGDLYIAYDHADAPEDGQKGFRTGVAPNGSVWFGDGEERYAPAAENRGEELEPVRLKVFRFCVGAPGEFTQDHGGTEPLALSAVTEYTNFVSAVFERDIDIRLQLTFGTQYVMFVDPVNDPYPGGTNQDFMSQNPSVLNQYTNFNSHDLGHVYIRGGGGVAGAIGNACGTNKAQGCSAGSGVNDYGDGFLYVVGQEVGHQLGGGHTWSYCGAGNDQRQGQTAFEPGSGSTIMSYAGGCGSDNIQFNADLYYHGGSIEEIKNYVTFTAACGSWQEKPNNVPVVTLPYPDNFNIPISTPFELNGSATDPDGDPLSYSWEGIDYGPESPLGQPQGNTAIFRSWPPVDVTNRYFPRLSTILANGSSVAEQLPTYTRDLTFRFTARDNRPDGGGVGWADVAFKAVSAAGPFLVMSPNTSGTIWHVGELTQVRWDVANTNAAPVNCQRVNIRLSTNAGQTYPITLAAGTENDGSQYVLVPDNLTSLARIRVEAADNVFFDLSNANFKIQNPTQPSLTLGLSTDGGTICLPDNFSTEIQTASVLGYNTPVAIDLVGSLPPGATASFSATNLNPGQSATLSVNLESVVVEGNFTFTMRAISGTDTLLRPISLLLRRNDFTGFALQTPADGSTNLGLTQTLHWGKGLDADNYDVQLSDSPSFSNILASSTFTALDSLKINFLLEKGKAYFWRVRPRNECGEHAWSGPFFFSTFAENCLSFTANDLPKGITSNGTPTIESKITVVQGGVLSDVVVSNISVYHDYFKDLEAHLISPQGTDVLLWKDRCSNSNGSFNFGFSDAAPTSLVCPPPTNGAIHKPQNPLAPIIGQNSTGVWTLRVRDKVSGSGGTLSNFQLQFCQSVNIQPPFLVNNVVMPLPSGTNRAITPDFLLVEDPNNAHGQLTFTVVTVPQQGQLFKVGYGEMKPGDQFTQADIDTEQLRFYDFGPSADPDGFRFVVTDGEGGFLGTPMFIAQPLVGTQDLGAVSIDFALYPNPAGSSVWVAFGQGLESAARVSLFNTAGQLVRTENMAAGQERLQIAVGQLPKGIYVVRAETEAGAGVRKLVVE